MGTVEIRVFDTPLSVAKAVNLAAFTRAIAGLQARLFDPVSGRWLIARDWALALYAQIEEQQPTPMDRPALEAMAAGVAGEEDHVRMRQLWRGLSPEGCLPGGAAPDGETLAAYSAVLCDLLLAES